MTDAVDQELLTFAARVIDRHGGAAERESDHLLAVLPERLGEVLELPEEAKLGGDGEPLLYGHPVLERLVRLATATVPVVYATLEVPYLKSGGFEQAIAQDLSFWNMGSRIVTQAEARNSYMLLSCHYLALSDERKEGLLQVAVAERTSALLPALREAWRSFEPRFYSAEEKPPHFPAEIGPAVKSALRQARSAAAVELAPFLASMTRHLQRDVRHTREYYRALEKEMQAQAERPRLSEERRAERREKIRELPHELERKIEDLRHKYRVAVKVRACGALRILVPVVALTVEARYRKLRRAVALCYNPVTHRIDPLACERCGETTRHVYPAERRSGIVLCCAPCSEK